jgi:hypothetical protein
MSAYNPDTINNDNDTFDQGESFGRYAMGQEILQLLKDAASDLRFYSRTDNVYTLTCLNDLIADIEKPAKRSADRARCNVGQMATETGATLHPSEAHRAIDEGNGVQGVMLALLGAPKGVG